MANSADTLTIRLALEGGAEVRKELGDTAQSAEKAGQQAASGAKEATQATQSFQLEVKGLVTLFDEFERGQRGSFFATLGEKFKEGIEGGRGLALALTALGGAFVGLAVKGAEAAAQIKEAAIRVGTSGENFSALKFVFEQSGAGAENFERAVGVIREAATDLSKSSDETLAAQQKFDEALRGIIKSQADAEDARNDDVRKLERTQGERLADLLEKQQKDRDAAFQKGTVDLVALQEEQDKAILDERDRSVKQLKDQQRAADDAREDEQVKAFKTAQDALLAYNKEIEELADKAGRAQISGSFISSDTAGKLRELGVVLTDVNGKARDSHDIFVDVAEKIGAIDDEATRSQVAIGLFGRRVGPALVESLSQGRKGIEELEAEAKALGLEFSSPELDIGKKFSDTLNKLGGTLAATSDKIGLAFAPLFGEVGEALAKAIGHAQPAIVAAAQGIANFLKPIFDGIVAGIENDFGAIAKLNPLGQAAAGIVGGFKIIGTVIADTAKLIGAALGQIGGLIDDVFGDGSAQQLAAWATAIYLVYKAVVILRTGLLALNVAAAANPYVLIGLAIVALVAVIVENWDTIKEFINYITDTKAWKLASDALGLFIDDVKTLIGWLKDAYDAAAKLAGALASEPAPGNAPSTGEAGDEAAPQGAAAGGLIRGPGSGTSDSIPARLSNGEFVINARATAAFLPLLHAINSGRGFSLGGFVDGLADRLDGMMPRGFAAGGLAFAGGGGNGGRPVILNLPGGGSFALRGDNDVVERLVRASRHEQIASAGRRPSSYGGGR